jgi:O-acetyl-ADP-ribose deacetylase
MPEFKLNQTTLIITEGDIVKAGTEAIVNAANPNLSDGAGVTGAIFKAAGPELAQHTAKLDGCPTGQARLTPAFQLYPPTRYIIHAVGPVYEDYPPVEAVQLLSNAYRSSLELAALNGIKSIAFPAISTGIYGFPLKMATAVALRTVLTFVKEATHSLEEIKFVVRGEQPLTIYRLDLAQLLAQLPAEATGDDTIYFYAKEEPYYEFSNSAPYGFFSNNTFWRTAEHYFQAQKFPKMALYEEIRQTATPLEAQELAQRNQRRWRSDWAELQEGVMRETLRLKFEDNPPIKQLWLSTGQRPLVAADEDDPLWGFGPDRQGQNKLGQMLMELRDQYREQAGQEPHFIEGEVRES